MRCELGEELTTTHYRDTKGRPKRVRWWLMRPLSGEFEPTRRGRRPALADARGGAGAAHVRARRRAARRSVLGGELPGGQPERRAFADAAARRRERHFELARDLGQDQRAGEEACAPARDGCRASRRSRRRAGWTGSRRRARARPGRTRGRRSARRRVRCRPLRARSRAAAARRRRTRRERPPAPPRSPPGQAGRSGAARRSAAASRGRRSAPRPGRAARCRRRPRSSRRRRRRRRRLLRRGSRARRPPRRRGGPPPRPRRRGRRPRSRGRSCRAGASARHPAGPVRVTTVSSSRTPSFRAIRAYSPVTAATSSSFARPDVTVMQDLLAEPEVRALLAERADAVLGDRRDQQPDRVRAHVDDPHAHPGHSGKHPGQTSELHRPRLRDPTARRVRRRARRCRFT